ncbi:MAG: hypothetical protein JRN20_01170 [Nitrososphaerota archaeon]|jgi:hypothetical protein|nr:hypothetical protein [Nitrososphaerota archaeon]MDG6922194.1 hypothetical protein [Nitrososphaerota archaeon]
MTDQLLSFVEKYLVVDDAKCSRHCTQKARFVPIDRTGSSTVVAYTCPANYVSKIVYFADDPDPAWFEKFLSDRIGKIRPRDLRKATRHGWELGGQAEKEIASVSKSKALTQYYWAPYPQTEEEKKYGAFLCSREDGGCGRLYTKLKNDESKLCPDCGKN